MSIKTDFINDGLKNYLSVMPSSSEKLNNYQLQMLQEKCFDFLLPVTVKQKNEVITLDYCIDASRSLERFLQENKRLSKDEFIQLVMELAGILLEKRQQLSADYFLLSKEFIYFNKDEFIPKLVFVPVKSFKGQCHNQFRKFITSLVPRCVYYAADEEMYSRILDELEEPDFNISSLLVIVERYKNNTLGLVAEPVREHVAIKANTVEKHVEKKKETTVRKTDYKTNPKVEKEKKVKLTIEDETPVEEKLKKKLLVFTMLQVVTVLLSFLIASSTQVVKNAVGGVVVLSIFDALFMFLMMKTKDFDDNAKEEVRNYHKKLSVISLQVIALLISILAITQFTIIKNTIGVIVLVVIFDFLVCYLMLRKKENENKEIEIKNYKQEITVKSTKNIR